MAGMNCGEKAALLSYVVFSSAGLAANALLPILDEERQGHLAIAIKLAQVLAAPLAVMSLKDSAIHVCRKGASAYGLMNIAIPVLFCVSSAMAAYQLADAPKQTAFNLPQSLLRFGSLLLFALVSVAEIYMFDRRKRMQDKTAGVVTPSSEGWLVAANIGMNGLVALVAVSRMLDQAAPLVTAGSVLSLLSMLALLGSWAARLTARPDIPLMSYADMLKQYDAKPELRQRNHASSGGAGAQAESVRDSGSPSHSMV